MKSFQLSLIALLWLAGLYSSNLYAQQQRVPAKKSTSTNTNTNTNTNKSNSNKSNTNNQTNSPSNSKGKIFWGGGVNTTTDGKNFIIDAQPYIGYRLTPKAQITAGPVYQYQGGNNISIYGARVASRYDIFAGAFAAGMFEYMNYNQNDQNHSLVRLPLGLGYSHSLFGIGANVSVMYDVLHNKSTSPYATPFMISGGFTLGNGGNGFNFGSQNFNINDAFNNIPGNKTSTKTKTNTKTNTNTNTNNKTSTDGKQRVPPKKKN